ncbi:MAG: hypothetical protein R3E83_02815 [Burkholderiaceae bacterium]
MSVLARAAPAPLARLLGRDSQPARSARPRPGAGIRNAEQDAPGLRPNPLRNFRAVAERAQSRLGKTGSIGEVRARLFRDGWQDAAVADALACTAQALAQRLGYRPRPNQWLAAAGLLDQRLIELDTGEGKTLAAAMAAGAAALAGTPVHLLTANDYLAARDAQAMAPAFATLGLSCRAAAGADDEPLRRDAYDADICYATARTVAFDYLRDQVSGPGTADRPNKAFLRGLCLAIVDEADAVLLDEALMPLVLAVGSTDPGHRARLWQTLDLARRLRPGRDFDVDHGDGQIFWTEAGLHQVATQSARYRGAWINDSHRDESVLQGLRALHLLERDVHYVLREDKVVLIDQTTGRAAPGRQLPGDLHGLVALKERLDPPAPTDAGTGLTYPRFFARYHHLCGLSGTLTEAATEFRRVYGMRISRVARDKPCRLKRYPTRMFANDAARTDAVIDRSARLADSGRPVLIGTDSIRQTRELAAAFSRRNIEAQCIDAGDDRNEAGAVAECGRAGRITIATQMAGRGTDIEPDRKALSAGGLHVLNLQVNRSARIDRQMSGRAARRGEPGSAEHWLSARSRPFENLTGPALRGLLSLARHRGRAGMFIRLVQAYWELEDRSARHASLSSDREGSRKLHFTSMGSR